MMGLHGTPGKNRDPIQIGAKGNQTSGDGRSTVAMNKVTWRWKKERGCLV